MVETQGQTLEPQEQLILAVAVAQEEASQLLLAAQAVPVS
jgi:hypothetical protein